MTKNIDGVDIEEDCPYKCPFTIRYSCDTYGRCYEDEQGTYSTLNQCHQAIVSGGGLCGPTRTPAATPLPPTPIGPTPTPLTAGSTSVNYAGKAIWDGYANFTTVGSNGGPSYYGTYDQSGNISEIIILNNTTSFDYYGRTYTRGGSYAMSLKNIVNYYYGSLNGGTIYNPRISAYYHWQTSIAVGGLRIASKKNPLSLPYFVLVGPDKTLSSGTKVYNSNDLSGFGSVLYDYYISQYPVTNCEYVRFLNAVARYDAGYYRSSLFLETNDATYGIRRTGSTGDWTYSSKPNMDLKPAHFLSTINAMRYCNWLSNGKPDVISIRDPALTQGVYNINPNEYIVSYNYANLTDDSYYIPTESEWYKAAYYDPTYSKKYYNLSTKSNVTYSSTYNQIDSLVGRVDTISANNHIIGPLPVSSVTSIGDGHYPSSYSC